MHTFLGIIAELIISGLLFMIVLGDSVWTAVRQVKLEKRPIHTWRSYLVGALLLSANLFAYSGRGPNEITGLRAYRIPAASMAPTLVPDDHIIADTRYYRNHAPQTGDLIVFTFPYQDHQIYIKRIVGVPGDRIKIVNHQVYLNGQKHNESYLSHDPTAPPDPFSISFPPVKPGEILGNMQPEWADRILSNVVEGELVVPPSTYFTLGDNREDSWDSRYWGPVVRNRIIGKALYIYWSDDKSRIGQTLR